MYAITFNIYLIPPLITKDHASGEVFFMPILKREEKVIIFNSFEGGITPRRGNFNPTWEGDETLIRSRAFQGIGLYILVIESTRKVCSTFWRSHFGSSQYKQKNRL